jgi:ParB-like chromosome segregation protein Spo0J
MSTGRARKTAIPEFHPLADIDPLIDGADYASLIEDIRKHGLREPIVLYQGKILDGRNRARACAEADVDLLFVEKTFTSDADAVAFLDSANLHRRHLTPKQKRQRIAARLKANPALSDRRVAKETGASHPHVAKVRCELEESGDVETVSTSTDTKGRQQPRRRSKPKVAPPEQQDDVAESAVEVAPAAVSPPSPPTEPANAKEPRTRRSKQQKLRDAAAVTASFLCGDDAVLAASFLCNTIELALDEDAIIDCLLTKDFDRTTEIVRHPKFKALAAAVTAKLGGNEPTSDRESGIRLIGLQSENEELRARIAELEAASATAEPASTNSAPIDANLDVRTFANGGLRRWPADAVKLK